MNLVNPGLTRHDFPFVTDNLTKGSLMAIHRLNHAVLYVRDVARSVAFYREILGFEVVIEIDGAAFLRAGGSTNDHDLGLFSVGTQAGPSEAGRSTVGLFHLAWEVETLRNLVELAQRLTDAIDHHVTKSLYGQDPDGLKFEIAWVVPSDQLDEAALARPDDTPLDLDREIARYGADTPGG
ncbi:VOC family protein [Nocardia sp. NPDC051570]|uniref:VOC family protein n=1 Tax=Nocardia sp. NPDC051570 TaxID=3364324 RepID=UPI003788D49D